MHSSKTGPLADILNSSGKATIKQSTEEAAPTPPTQPRPLPQLPPLTPRNVGIGLIAVFVVGAMLGRCGAGTAPTSEASVFATSTPVAALAPGATGVITTQSATFALWAPNTGAGALDLAPGQYTLTYRWGSEFVQLSPGDVWLPTSSPALTNVDLTTIQALPLHPDYAKAGGVQ